MKNLDSAIDDLVTAAKEVHSAVQTIPEGWEPFYAGYLIAAVERLMSIQAEILPTIEALLPSIRKQLPLLCQQLREQKNLP